MMAEQLPPDWAIERAMQLCGVASSMTIASAKGLAGGTPWVAFARYIAEHEDAPVDPLLIEARGIVASETTCLLSKDAYTNGSWDDTIAVRSALRALRRGIKIGRGES